MDERGSTMLSQFEAEAIAAARAFIDAFNAQDHEALADTLNYPHVRLATGRFVTIQSRDEFVQRSKNGTRQLEAEGWDHTVMRSIEVVHAGEDKVHLAITIDRRHPDDGVYNTFETLWIATRQDAHWGIQFRSSYLM